MKRIVCLFVCLIGLTAPAFAQPDGIRSVDGWWQTSDGRPLYYFNSARPALPSMLCGLRCVDDIDEDVGRYHPVTVGDDVALAEPWGRRALYDEWVLTYRGRAMLVWSGDRAAASAYLTGPRWRQAPDVESYDPIPASDPSITRQPAIDINRSLLPEFPAASRRAEESGVTVLDLCIRPEGEVIWASVSASSGFDRLDDASLSYAFQSFTMTPAIAGDTAVAVCGLEKAIVWTLNTR